jgi:hypothetical protein
MALASFLPPSCASKRVVELSCNDPADDNNNDETSCNQLSDFSSSYDEYIPFSPVDPPWTPTSSVALLGPDATNCLIYTASFQRSSAVLSTPIKDALYKLYKLSRCLMT